MEQEYLYVLLLQGGKWYIGRSKTPSDRIEDHCNGAGSVWTQEYPVIDLWDMRKAFSPLEEDHLTEQYMSDYGIENFRGGSYSQMELP